MRNDSPLRYDTAIEILLRGQYVEVAYDRIGSARERYDDEHGNYTVCEEFAEECVSVRFPGRTAADMPTVPFEQLSEDDQIAVRNAIAEHRQIVTMDELHADKCRLEWLQATA